MLLHTSTHVGSLSIHQTKAQESSQEHHCTTSNSNHTVEGLNDNITEQVQCMLVNLYVATIPGCLPNTFGKEKVES